MLAAGPTQNTVTAAPASADQPAVKRLKLPADVPEDLVDTVMSIQPAPAGRVNRRRHGAEAQHAGAKYFGVSNKKKCAP